MDPFEAGVIIGMEKVAYSNFRLMRAMLSEPVVGAAAGGVFGAAVSPSEDRMKMVIPGMIMGGLMGKRLGKRFGASNVRRAGPIRQPAYKV